MSEIEKIYRSAAHGGSAPFASSRLYRVYRMAVCILFGSALSACGMTYDKYAQNRYTLSDDDVCAGFAKAKSSNNFSFMRAVQNDMRERSLSEGDCEARNSARRSGAAQALAAVVAIGALAALAAKSGGGGPVASGFSGGEDYSWAWDLIHAPSGYGSIWVCRGKQTGKFSDLWRCGGMIQNDDTWPGLGEPVR